MPVDAAGALAAAPRVREIAWDHKDVQLYHLGIGAGRPATDPRELRYTLESRLHVLPSFATVAGGGAPGVIGTLSAPGVDVDLARVLHGGQRLRLHRPVPVRGRASAASRVVAVYDKGTAAVLVLRTEVTDADGPLWTDEAEVFVRGEGGWGGERGPSGRPRRRPPTRRTRLWTGPYGRTRRCSTGSPATGTPCTPTRSSRRGPASNGPCCTACAPMAPHSRRSSTHCWTAT